MKAQADLRKKVHSGLPISPDEQIIAIYKHHWFAYAVIWLSGFAAIAIIWITVFSFMSGNSAVASQNSQVLYAAAGLFSIILALGTLVPIMMRLGEQLIVTDEAVFQVLQPSVFSSKVSQLALQHVNDVSVRKDFFGTIFGYGTVTIETPGEQANYHFRACARPDEAVSVIVEAHENFSAALESGKVPTTLKRNGQDEHSVTIDAAEYQRFLDFQQYQARARQEMNDKETEAGQQEKTTSTEKNTPFADWH